MSRVGPQGHRRERERERERKGGRVLKRGRHKMYLFSKHFRQDICQIFNLPVADYHFARNLQLVRCTIPMFPDFFYAIRNGVSA